MSGKAKDRKTFGKKIKDQSDGLSELYSLQGKGAVMASTKSAVTGSINNTEIAGQFMQVATTDLNMKTYDILDVDRLKFASESMETSDPLTSTDYGIEALYTVVNGVETAYGMSFRIPATKLYYFNSGSGQMTFSDNAGLITGQSITGGSLSTGTYLDVANIASPANPSSSHVRLFADEDNSDHLTVRRSDGSEVDLEGGTTGANQQLSNLSGVIAINQSLLPATSENKNLGSTSKEWATLYLSSGLYFGAGQNSSTLNHSSGLLFNIEDDNDWYQFNIDGDRKMSIGDDEIVIDGDLDPDTDETRDLGSSTKEWHNIWGKTVQGVSYVDFETTNTRIFDSSGSLQVESNSGISFFVGGNSEFQINSSGLYLSTHSTPSSLANGMIWNDGTDVHVRTGGATKNMSDIGSGGGGGSFDGTCTFDLLPSGSARDVGSSGNEFEYVYCKYLKLAGGTSKKIDTGGGDIEVDGGDILMSGGDIDMGNGDIDNVNAIDCDDIIGTGVFAWSGSGSFQTTCNITALYSGTIYIGQSNDDVGFFGASAVGKQTIPSNATLAQVVTALRNLGLGS